MALRASLQAVVDAVTAEANATDKTTALLSGLVTALGKEGSSVYPAPVNRTVRMADVQTELVDNVADFVTALTVA